ncbi:GNAT family N-acetyltransferase [Rhodanobacter hydrolyticus]|uniref:GNAT family N-acetyltransferase n=1 Tax=Rhodanobacter hydrolyticus TaxID=2250595 RepID=A0ABW8J1A9_9GAMM
MAALRTARVDDAMEIARLAGELGYPLGVAAMEDRLRAILPLPQHHVTVAQDGNGGLLGWIAIERRLTLESGERIEIVGLVVDAAARGTGIGRALVADGEHGHTRRASSRSACVPTWRASVRTRFTKISGMRGSRRSTYIARY